MKECSDCSYGHGREEKSTKMRIKQSTQRLARIAGQCMKTLKISKVNKLYLLTRPLPALLDKVAARHPARTAGKSAGTIRMRCCGAEAREWVPTALPLPANAKGRIIAFGSAAKRPKERQERQKAAEENLYLDRRIWGIDYLHYSAIVVVWGKFYGEP